MPKKQKKEAVVEEVEEVEEQIEADKPVKVPKKSASAPQKKPPAGMSALTKIMDSARKMREKDKKTPWKDLVSKASKNYRKTQNV